MRKRLSLRTRKIAPSWMTKSMRMIHRFTEDLNIELDRNRRQEQRQRRDEIEDCEELFGEAQTSDNKVLKELAEKLNAYIQELPVVDFNSGKYDLNAVKEFLFPYLIEHNPIKFTVKRNSNHMCLKTNFLKFLDITNYLAPGFSYDQILKAYECEQIERFLSLRVDRQPGQPRGNIATPSRHLLFISEERRQHHRRRIPVLSTGLGRQGNVHL